MKKDSMNNMHDDGTLEWWLRLADAIEECATRADRQAHADRVRHAIGSHTDRFVRWNVRICDYLDVAISMAPREGGGP